MVGSILNKAMYHILWRNTLNLIVELLLLFSLFGKNLLKHLVLLAEIILMLGIDLLRPWRILD